MRQHIRRSLRYARNAVVGAPDTPLMTKLIRGDQRAQTFFNAIDYINYEQVEGDILEFGVFTGISLALLAQGHAFENKGMTRRIAGFDSFEGLPDSSDEHSRWREGACGTNHVWHPFLAVGEPVSPETTTKLFEACGLGKPELHVGYFEQTVSRVIPSVYSKVALVHVDCDLRESTLTALEGVGPALQDGAVLLFDDWYHYRGNPDKGEAGAYAAYLAAHPEWRSVHYRSYGTFCNAFILSRR